jgi:hypothetical protein
MPEPRRRMLGAALLSLYLVLSMLPGNAQSAEALTWSSLTPAQQQALTPLKEEWGALPENRRLKWREMADRFSSLTPTQQHRVQERMARWAQMSAQQREHARQNYQQLRKVPPKERQEKWEAYQRLSPEERRALAAKAKQRSVDPKAIHAPGQQHGRAPTQKEALSNVESGAAKASKPSIPASGISSGVSAPPAPSDKGRP